VAIAAKPRKRPEEPPTTVRCPSCQGLRIVSARRARDRKESLCAECAAGHIVTRTEFFSFWLERFSLSEIKEMGRAIWG
jgi:hypothetical protein